MIGDHFEFTPSAGFEGRTSFKYTYCAEGRCDTAQVEVVVFNFFPAKQSWRFSTSKSSPLPIIYNVPIDDFHFEVLSVPNHGTVSVEEQDKELIYHPDSDFVGGDMFQVKYCVDHGTGEACEILQIQIEVHEDGPGMDCINACVWPGDLDANGSVDVEDLMPLSANLGARGPVINRGDLNEWYGRTVDNWPVQLAFGPSNLKHVDADGDGKVTTDDLVLISRFYGKTHQLVPSVPPFGETLTLELELLTPDVKVGDEAVVQVRLNNSSGENISLVGVSFSFVINARFADSSSFRFIPDPQGIFDPDVAVLSYFLSPEDGRLDIGVAQTERKETPAHGVLGKVTFIVEEDLNGFRSIKDLFNVRMDAKQVHVRGTNGLAFGLGEVSEHIAIRSSATPHSDQSLVNIYPNPAIEEVTIDHVNPLKFIRLIGLDGSTYYQWQGQSAKTVYKIQIQH